MKKLAMALVCLCLIAFLNKETFQQSPAAHLAALMQIYLEKHPGTDCKQFSCAKPAVTIGENKLGQIVIIIDHPKTEI